MMAKKFAMKISAFEAFALNVGACDQKFSKNAIQ
jgi:hypothetical protein